VSDNIDPNWAPVGSLQNQVRLRRPQSQFILALIGLIGLAIATYYIFSTSEYDYYRFFGFINIPAALLKWFVFIGLLLAALAALANLIRPPTLILNREGFEETSITKSQTHKWEDVSELASVARANAGRRGGAIVAFYHLTDDQIDNTGSTPEITQERPEAGRLRDNYGVKHEELLELMRAFRNRSLEESGEAAKPALAAFAQTSSDASAPADWQSINELGIGYDGYDAGKERAPWLKWGLSGILITTVAGGAIWLTSVVLSPENIPETKIEFPTADVSEPEEDAPPPKSADEQAWIEALEKDTLEGYRDYIETFPNGRFVDKAQAEIDKYDDQDWATAQQRNTIAGYEDYLAEWPEGKYAPKAQELIDKMKKAIEAQRKDAAEWAAREARAWQTAEAANSLQSYQDYLSQYPSGKNAVEAQARIDRMNADAATAQALAIEERAWASAKSANTVESYQTYLASYPNGTYAPLAKAELEELKPSPGKTYRDCEVCPAMLTLASGNSQLGAGTGEPGVKPNEQPKRPVIINSSFSIGVTEVTFAQWDACVAAGGCTTRPNDNGWGRGNRPVVNVSWDDAQGYANWLSTKTGKPYQLPSEAQWEYAARGGETGYYIGGSAKALCAFANGAGTESGLTWANMECSDLSSDRTLPVGSLSANKLGLMDMLGNVQEWTLDCNTLNLKDAPTNGDPDLRGSCNQRVVRGGSWFSPPTGLRFTTRENQRRGDSNDFTGFRVVRK